MALLIAALVCVAAFANAAHPLRVSDYSDGHRIGLEIAYAKLNNPVPATATHYLLDAQANVYPGVHVRLGLPFSGYSGVDGADNFIRGNVLLGASWRLPLVDWMALGFELRLYLPTYEQADAVDFGLPQDPRRAVLTHWHYHFQYALEDNFPIVPNLAARFVKQGFFAQLEGGFTWAPQVREQDDRPRKDHVMLGHWAAMVGYDLFGYVELGGGVTGLVDATAETANMADVLGLPVGAPHSLTASTVGLRAQYKWAVFRFEANFPLEPDFRAMLDPWYLFTLQAQFP